MKSIVIASLFALAIGTGCATAPQQAENQVIFPRTEGTAYLDASRAVIEDQGWTLLSERGNTKRSAAGGEEQVTITGETTDGKKVHFTVTGSTEAKTATLTVTADEAFPMSPEQLLDLVRSKNNT